MIRNAASGDGCALRAAVKPAIRRVVWVTDKTVLDADERDGVFPDDTVLATVGLSDTVSGKAVSLQSQGPFFFVERAFTSAEDQQP